MEPYLEFRPDWSQLIAADKINTYLGNGFIFAGPGWYFASDKSVMLIIPRDRSAKNMWKQDYSNIERMIIHYFAGNPRAMMELVVTAPTIVDDRI